MEDQNYALHLARDYDRSATQYRIDDEIEARSENHRRLGAHLQRICNSFPHPVRVMEIGCGTGRYFHWLQNVDLLVGSDLSPEMLKKAKHPVHEQEVTAKQIQLIQGNVFEMDFAPASFDFIFSLGVFGNGAVWSPALSAKVHHWLAPGGRLFFNAIEMPHCATRVDRWKQIVKCGMYPIVPEPVRQWLNAGQTVPMVRHTPRHVAQVTRSAGFRKLVVSSHRCQSPLWNGTHVECNAQKEPTSDACLETADSAHTATA